jgi:hypothetical protein
VTDPTCLQVDEDLVVLRIIELKVLDNEVPIEFLEYCRSYLHLILLRRDWLR